MYRPTIYFISEGKIFTAFYLDTFSKIRILEDVLFLDSYRVSYSYYDSFRANADAKKYYYTEVATIEIRFKKYKERNNDKVVDQGTR